MIHSKNICFCLQSLPSSVWFNKRLKCLDGIVDCECGSIIFSSSAICYGVSSDILIQSIFCVGSNLTVKSLSCGKSCIVFSNTYFKLFRFSKLTDVCQLEIIYAKPAG